MTDNQAEIQQPETDDIDADLRNAMEQLKVESPPESKVVIDKQPERVRDETGKFAEAPKEKQKRETLTVPKPDVATQGVSAEQPALGVAAPAIKAPEGWKGELKTKFGELPDWAQQEISRRESDMHKAITKQDDERTFAKRINEIVSPYLPTIRAENGTPEKAIESLLQTAHVLRAGTPQQKAHSVAMVMQQFKVSPQDLFSILQGSNGNNGGTVQQSQFNPALETLQQRVDRMEQERQQEIQQRQLQEEHSLNSQIEGFASQPGHEHFDQVKKLMGVLLESGEANDLEDAYQQAIHARPEIRSSLIAAQTQADQGKRLTELNAKTERAKSAAGSVTGGPGSARPVNGTGSLGSIEDDLRAAMREHSGRV